MISVTLEGPTDLAGWRREALHLDAEDVPADQVVWRVAGGDGDLFGAPSPAAATARKQPARSLPEALEGLLDTMLLHRDPERFALAYRMLRRLGVEPHLLQIASDADVVRAVLMAKAVRRDQHKMKAFVRFRAVAGPTGEVMVAWFEPDHHITGSVAPFFMRRFTSMRWSILTPEASAHWDRESLTFGPGASRADAPTGDALEEHWKSYYAAIFNPARMKPKAMKKEMPVRYWRNLPEAELIKPLMQAAPSRVRAMQASVPTPSRSAIALRETEAMQEDNGLGKPGTLGVVLDSLDGLKAALDGCRRCPLYADATQGVPGEGPPHADIMFVGEQPGDQEDLAGRPFVGPAGNLFNIALERTEIDRSRVYVTNGVKHFKFEPRGKRRIHMKPNTTEIDACRWWIDHEVKIVRPKLIVALGATGAFSVTGKALPVQQSRGRIIPGDEWPTDRKRAPAGHAGNSRPDLLITVHPSYLLRLQSEEDKRREWKAFLADLRMVKDYAEKLAA